MGRRSGKKKEKAKKPIKYVSAPIDNEPHREDTFAEKALHWEDVLMVAVQSIIIVLGVLAGVKYYEFWESVGTQLSIVCSVTGVTAAGAYGFVKSRRVHKWLRKLSFSFIVVLVIPFLLSSFGLNGSEAAPDSGQAEEPGGIEVVDSAEPVSEMATDVGSNGYYPGQGPAEIDPETIEISGDGFEKGTEAEEMFHVIDDSLYESLENKINGEHKKLIKSSLVECLMKKVGTGTSPADSEVNGNRDFTALTEKANELSKVLDEKGMDEKLLKKILKLREDAFEIYELKNLTKLLANNYNKLGTYCYKMERSEDAFLALQKALEYEMKYLTFLQSEDAEYYSHIYKSGMILQLLGDIEWPGQDCNMQLYLLSACLLEIAADHFDPVEDEQYFFFSSYYAGMVNHKLCSYTKAAGDETCYIYIRDAFLYYQMSLSADNMRRQRNDQYRYIMQVCQNGCWYHRAFTDKEGFPSAEEFRVYEETYRKKLFERQ